MRVPEPPARSRGRAPWLSSARVTAQGRRGGQPPVVLSPRRGACRRSQGRDEPPDFLRHGSESAPYAARGLAPTPRPPRRRKRVGKFETGRAAALPFNKPRALWGSVDGYPVPG